MPEILFARNVSSPRTLVGDDPETLDALLTCNGLQLNDLLAPGNAYSPDLADPQTPAVVRSINAIPQAHRTSLARTAEAMGDETHRLVAFFESNLSPGAMEKTNALVGAGTSAPASGSDASRRRPGREPPTRRWVRRIGSNWIGSPRKSTETPIAAVR